jgi:hypothetical protein
MRKASFGIFALLFCVLALRAGNQQNGAIHGTVTKVDTAAKTITIEASNGSKETLRVSENTTVYMKDRSGQLGKRSWTDLKDGSEVVAHYSKRGTEAVATEVDKVGNDGLKTTEGTVSAIDKGTRKVTVKTADGAEETYHLTEQAAKTAGIDTAKATQKGAKVSLYYTEDAGKKVAHFFEFH